MTDKEIVSDYLISKLSEKEVSAIASLLRDRSARIFGDVILTDLNDVASCYQLISIKTNGFASSQVIPESPNSPYAF